MLVKFNPEEADDFLGDETYGVFINTARVRTKTYYYTLTKVMEGTPVVEAADVGPFDCPVDVRQKATEHAQRILDGL